MIGSSDTSYMNFVFMNPPSILPNLLLVCSPQILFENQMYKENAKITIYFHRKSHLILWKHLMGSQRLFGWLFLSHILSHHHNPRCAESAWDITYLGKSAYCTSMNSFCGKYSFLNLQIVENSNSCRKFTYITHFICENYSREETIQTWNYLQKYSIH